ncbi:hypothetical protein C8039_19875 [Halogeometricum sp. wsp3]|nr:hypothetical protein C8039_19875 [Halogeometricum sp. wsp3]
MNGPRRSMPVFEVDAITHRHEPRLPICVERMRCRIRTESTSTLRLVAAVPDATVGLRAAGFRCDGGPVALYLPHRLGHRD